MWAKGTKLGRRRVEPAVEARLRQTTRCDMSRCRRTIRSDFKSVTPKLRHLGQAATQQRTALASQAVAARRGGNYQIRQPLIEPAASRTLPIGGVVDAEQKLQVEIKYA